VRALGREAAEAPLGALVGLRWDAGRSTLAPADEGAESDEARAVLAQFLRLELLVRPYAA
jgi:hypothetical protein